MLSEKPFKKPYNCIMGLVESLPLFANLGPTFWVNINPAQKMTMSIDL